MATQTHTNVPVRSEPRRFSEQVLEPFTRLRGEVNRLFEDFPNRWPPFQFDALAPRLQMPAMEMTETDREYKISVEVPGMQAQDIDVSVQDDMLVISGEKKEEHEEKERHCYRSERSYGAFERRLSLPPTAEAEKIKAVSKQGVLHITIPKNGKAAQKHRIEIQTTD